LVVEFTKIQKLALQHQRRTCVAKLGLIFAMRERDVSSHL